jgi:hypothetical protein
MLAKIRIVILCSLVALEAKSTPGALVRLEGLGKLKKKIQLPHLDSNLRPFGL